jgi:alpha-1,6-mannosyltransferase
MSTFIPCRGACHAGLAALTLLAGAALMRPFGDLVLPGMVPPFLLGAAVMVAGYFWALAGGQRNLSVPLILGVAIAARILLLGQDPGNDIFRYIWEGRVLLHHGNPYLHAPDAVEFLPLRDTLWASVSLKTFSAVYPPLAEWIFALLAGISPGVIFFKTVFAAADCLAGWCLARRFGWPAAVLYLWNPIVITSFAGGGHYDSLFILALVLGWLAWDDGKFRPALLWLGAAVAIKWMALPLLAWAVWRRFQDRDRNLVAGFSALTLGMTPFLIAWLGLCLWSGEWTLKMHPDQFTEFARSAEFLPRLIGEIWPASQYQNSWFLIPLALAWITVILRARSFVAAAEGTLFFTLILSPLIHIWYFTWMIPFAVVSRNRGTLLLSASGFVYFSLYHRLEMTPEVQWQLTLVETLLLWTPFVLGFLWSSLPTNRKPPIPSPSS